MATITEVWTARVEPVDSIALADDVVVTVGSMTLTAFDLTDGGRRWEQEIFNTKNGPDLTVDLTAIVVDDPMYGIHRFDPRSGAFISSTDATRPGGRPTLGLGLSYDNEVITDPAGTRFPPGDQPPAWGPMASMTADGFVIVNGWKGDIRMYDPSGTLAYRTDVTMEDRESPVAVRDRTVAFVAADGVLRVFTIDDA